MPQSLPTFDPYRVLGVAPDASMATIDAAWKALLRRHHPDVADDKVASEATTKRLNAAHDWLSDPILRARIDAARRPRPAPPPRRAATPPPPATPRPRPTRRPAPPPPRPAQGRRPMPWVVGAAAIGILALGLGGARLGGPVAAPAAAVTQASAAACDPSYPSLCIDLGIGDLDCRDIGARRFPVRPPDRHRFDMDGDGIGCE